jgi:DNA (cytosine-5)-methyltransferase 1
MSDFSFVDLFAGLGGFHVAGRNLGGTCVFASEIQPHLRELYRENFGHEISGDLRDVPATKIPGHDVLFAGFPCQPFSKAGEQLGWEDATRGTLFWDIARVIRRHKPRLVLLENVANFVHHDDGNTYETVQQCLADLGYNVDFRKYSPHQFGVPQVRERVFILAKRGKRTSIVWPDREFQEKQLSIRSVLDVNPTDATPLSKRDVECLETWQDFLNSIPRETKLPSFPIWGMEYQATYKYDQDSLSRIDLSSLQTMRGAFGNPLASLTRAEILLAVPSYARGKKKAFPKWKQDFIRQNREFFSNHSPYLSKWLEKIQKFPPSLQKFEWNCQGEERNIWQYVLQFRPSGIRTRRTYTSPSLVAMTTTQTPVIAWEKRYLTVREAARLQSLESLTYLPTGDLAHEALGNAVNSRVVERILRVNL